jgi:hypothetical protein
VNEELTTSGRAGSEYTDAGMLPKEGYQKGQERIATLRQLLGNKPEEKKAKQQTWESRSSRSQTKLWPAEQSTASGRHYKSWHSEEERRGHYDDNPLQSNLLKAYKSTQLCLQKLVARQEVQHATECSALEKRVQEKHDVRHTPWQS